MSESTALGNIGPAVSSTIPGIGTGNPGSISSDFVENGSAVPISINQSDLPAIKINSELPFKGLLTQFPLII